MTNPKVWNRCSNCDDKSFSYKIEWILIKHSELNLSRKIVQHIAPWNGKISTILFSFIVFKKVFYIHLNLKLHSNWLHIENLRTGPKIEIFLLFFLSLLASFTWILEWWNKNDTVSTHGPFFWKNLVLSISFYKIFQVIYYIPRGPLSTHYSFCS